MVRKKGKVRKQTYRSLRLRFAKTELSQDRITKAIPQPERVRAVGDRRLRHVGKLSANVGEALGGVLSTLRVAICDAYFNQHVRASLRRKYARQLVGVIDFQDFVGVYKSAIVFQRITLVKEIKSGEYLGVGLDLAEDTEEFVYVISTLRRERRLAIKRRAEGIGKIGTGGLKRVQKQNRTLTGARLPYDHALAGEPSRRNFYLKVRWLDHNTRNRIVN